MEFARRTNNIGSSHIREILKVAAQPDMISFAGGLPNPRLFPVAGLARAAERVLKNHGHAALQYASSEGLPELRQWISERYLRRHGLRISPDEILITSGSQQALDLLGKVLIDPGRPVIVEEPSYLGALQAFAYYEPRFYRVPLEGDGVDTERLARLVDRLAQDTGPAPIYYTTPDFQNPAGIRCSAAKRAVVAALAERAIVIEDNPYGELSYDAGSDDDGERPATERPLLRTLSDRVVLLGSFSKIVAPGMRLGWVCAPRPLYERLIVARQAADLHTSSLSQLVLAEFLHAEDLDRHLSELRAVYRANRDLMIDAIGEHLPDLSPYVRPGGGMFLWCRLSEGLSASELFDGARAERVLFVPGGAFFTGDEHDGDRYLRLNFSNAEPDAIQEGVRRLGRAIDRLRSETNKSQRRPGRLRNAARTA